MFFGKVQYEITDIPKLLIDRLLHILFTGLDKLRLNRLLNLSNFFIFRIKPQPEFTSFRTDVDMSL